jgi:hypothetical protein
MARDLVEPEGVNAGSDAAMTDAPPTGDPVPGGGDPAGAADPERPDVDHVLGAPPEPAENTDEVFGSTPPA